jgi:hypothetical protein
MATVAADLRQGDRHRIAPPELQRHTPPLMSRYDMRFDAASAGWALGAPDLTTHAKPRTWRGFPELGVPP